MNFGHPGRRDLDLLAGGRVPALARAALRDAELAEPREGHVAAALERVLDRRPAWRRPPRRRPSCSDPARSATWSMNSDFVTCSSFEVVGIVEANTVRGRRFPCRGPAPFSAGIRRARRNAPCFTQFAESSTASPRRRPGRHRPGTVESRGPSRRVAGDRRCLLAAEPRARVRLCRLTVRGGAGGRAQPRLAALSRVRRASAAPSTLLGADRPRLTCRTMTLSDHCGAPNLRQDVSACRDVAPVCRLRSRSAPDLLARPHPILRLEVDQDVGASQPPADRVLELVRGPVGVLQRGAVRGTGRGGRRSGASPPGGCAARGSRRRLRTPNASIAARIAATSSPAAPRRRAPGAERVSSRTPVTTIAAATSQRHHRVDPLRAGDRHQHQRDQHGRRGQRRRSAGARRRPRAPATRSPRRSAAITADTSTLTTTENATTAIPMPTAARARRPTRWRIACERDRRRPDQDQDALDRRRQVLDLLVAVAVALVGRLAGLADREERDDRGDQVDARVDRLGEDRDRAGDRSRRPP